MADTGAPPTVRAHVVGLTDVGRVREHNEDSYLVVDREDGKPLPAGQVLDVELKSALLLVVCDGMGGAAAGEVASQMAATRVSEVLTKADYTTATPDMIASLMDQAVQQANTEIFEIARSDSEKKGMGTTLTAAVVTSGRLFISQVGDSRGYLLRKGLLNQMTKDQSLIGQLIEEGTLTEEEAEKLGGRNIVLQAVGVEETLRVDTKSWPLLRGDVVLLCSDGLSGMLKDARMREILTEAGNDLHAAADKLIAEANENGGRDNITCVIGRFDGEGLRPPMETEAAGTLEAAGAAFKAPPPPDVPNPMKKVAAWGGVLLAAILAAFVVFRPTKANLSFPMRPLGATVSVLDEKGNVVQSVVAGAEPVRFDELELGKYRFEMKADKHFPQSTDAFTIDQPGHKDLPPVWLVPHPGKLIVSAADPNVTVKLTLANDHPEGRPIVGEMLRLPVPHEAQALDSVSVGTWTAEASRPGFRTKVLTDHLDPDEDEKIEFPKLDELTGTLVIQGCAGGRVEVGAAAGGGFVDEVSAGDTWEKSLRAVELTVRVTWKGYQPFEQTVDLAEGARKTVVVTRVPETVEVEITGPPQSLIILDVREGEKWRKVKDVPTKKSGAADVINLVPGHYRARIERGSGMKEFDVEPGSPKIPVEVPVK